MEEEKVYFYKFEMQLQDREREYTELTQKEWVEKFYDLFGKESKSAIFSNHL